MFNLKDKIGGKILKIHRAMKKWLSQVLFKKCLTPSALVLIYFLVLGPTSLITKLFLRHKLSKSSMDIDSGWNKVIDYEGTIDDSLKQS